MSSIKILHASDLHIAIAEQRRSFKDAMEDAVRAVAKLRPKATFLALRKMSLASSYDAQVLEHLAELIVLNAKHVKPDVEQLPEDFARQKHLVFVREKLDAVIFTGDLATTGLDGDIERVNSFLNADYIRDSPHKPKDPTLGIATLASIDTTKTHIVCLPGNHDRYQFLFNRPIPTYFPGGKVFDSEVLDYQSEPVRTFAIPASGNLQVVIFAADFTLKRLLDCDCGFGWIAQGRVYHGKNSVLEKLVEKTIKKKDDVARQNPGTHLCILWALHFPPAFPDQSDLHKLIDEGELLKIADEIGVHGILAGHTHFQKKYRDDDPKQSPVFCCGTSTQHEPASSVQNLPPDSPTGNFFQILTVSADEGGAIHIKCDEYKYSVTAGQAGMTEVHWREYHR